MRNILQYPLTPDEVIAFLKRKQQELNEQPITYESMDGVIIHQLLEYFNSHPNLLQNVCNVDQECNYA